jgi:hypothetical protein
MGRRKSSVTLKVEEAIREHWNEDITNREVAEKVYDSLLNKECREEQLNSLTRKVGRILARPKDPVTKEIVRGSSGAKLQYTEEDRSAKGKRKKYTEITPEEREALAVTKDKISLKHRIGAETQRTEADFQRRFQSRIDRLMSELGIVEEYRSEFRERYFGSSGGDNHEH